jgi:peptide/nickel transport system substrate-binding protein
MKTSKIFVVLSILLIAVMVVACGGGNNDPANNNAENVDNVENVENANSNNNDAPETGDNDESTDPVDVDFEYPFKNPGTYVVADPGDPETLDPHWTYETSGSAIQNNVYEGLVWFERERTDSFVPMLATDWEATEGGKVWTFNIREGVTFHEGGTLEPHDVAYSMWRALLQDRIDGPHWMTHEMFFGTYHMASNVGDGEYHDLSEATPEELVEACELIKSAVVADDEAGTVTYNLISPAPWFLAVMSNSFAGAVVDMEWMTEHGDWDSSCDTWVEFNDPSAEDTILFDFMNGTGPYKLDHWTQGEEIVLVRNEDYWRADDDPMWEGGPSGLASIERVVILNVNEWGTRLAMFEAGDADYAFTPALYNSQVEPFYGVVECGDPNHRSCVEPAEDGWIHAYVGNARPAMDAPLFNQMLTSEGGNVFQGSGELDGNGIPDDFFQDIHIRKAFSYCFDYETVIEEALAGEGTQAQGPILAEMLGYRDDGLMYSYDPDKCIEEFQASESGVWDTGFYMQIAYNTGNDRRRLASEVLKAGIEAVNPNFQIQVVGMPWPVLLNTRRAGKLPIYVGGWLEDFHDPHNWVHPYLHSHGAYGRVLNLTEELAAEIDGLIAEAAASADPEVRRPIYEEIQLRAQEEALAIWAYQQMVRYHFSPWIEGWYFNPAYTMGAYAYIYALDKVGP